MFLNYSREKLLMLFFPCSFLVLSCYYLAENNGCSIWFGLVWSGLGNWDWDSDCSKRLSGTSLGFITWFQPLWFEAFFIEPSLAKFECHLV